MLFIHEWSTINKKDHEPLSASYTAIVWKKQTKQNKKRWVVHCGWLDTFINLLLIEMDWKTNKLTTDNKNSNGMFKRCLTSEKCLSARYIKPEVSVKFSLFTGEYRNKHMSWWTYLARGLSCKKNPNHSPNHGLRKQM